MKDHEEEDAMESDSHKIVYELQAPPCMHGSGSDQHGEYFENKVTMLSGPILVTGEVYMWDGSE